MGHSLTSGKRVNQPEEREHVLGTNSFRTVDEGTPEREYKSEYSKGKCVFSLHEGEDKTSGEAGEGKAEEGTAKRPWPTCSCFIHSTLSLAFLQPNHKTAKNLCLAPVARGAV